MLLGVTTEASILIPLLWDKEKREYLQNRFHNDPEARMLGVLVYPFFIAIGIIAWPIIAIGHLKKKDKTK
jgi:hypothetical protein